MKVFTSVNDPEISRLLDAGGIGVLRTDTLYGLVAKADNEAAVERVYAAKGRDQTKSPIVLVASEDQLFDAIPETARPMIAEVWPGKVSVILSAVNAPSWIQRGNASVAYRLPKDTALAKLISATGPLIAPSANPEGDPPAMNIEQAQNYFKETVDFYVDGGEVSDSTPSRLLRIDTNGTIERFR